ncbi:MAG: hypothetical protein R3D02_13640 [Hyphomicrobiales bacterium]
MTIRTAIIALGALGLSAIATVPAAADSITLSFGSHGSAITVRDTDSRRHVRPAGPTELRPVVVDNRGGYRDFDRRDGRRDFDRRDRHDWGHHRISNHRAFREVRDRGFREIRFVEETRRAYVFTARGHRGHRVTVFVDARNGDVTIARQWR